MWNSASTLSLLSTIFTDTGVVLMLVIGAITTAIVAFLGLGFAVGRIRAHIFASDHGYNFSRMNRRIKEQIYDNPWHKGKYEFE